MSVVFLVFLYFFVKDAAPTEIYTYGHTLSLHDALPIWSPPVGLLGLLGGSGLCGLVALDVDDGLVEPLARQRPEFGRADVHHLRDQGPVLVEEVPDPSLGAGDVLDAGVCGAGGWPFGAAISASARSTSSRLWASTRRFLTASSMASSPIWSCRDRKSTRLNSSH